MSSFYKNESRDSHSQNAFTNVLEPHDPSIYTLSMALDIGLTIFREIVFYTSSLIDKVYIDGSFYSKTVAGVLMRV